MMPLPSTHIQELIHVAHVGAIAAHAGVACYVDGHSDYGVDARLKYVKQTPSGQFHATGFTLHCQLKATTTLEVRGQDIVFDMKAEAYNKIVEFEGGTCVLVVLRLPSDQTQWLRLAEDELTLRNCCYWTLLKGPPTKNASSQRVLIPRNQLFTPEAIIQLLDDERKRYTQ